MVLNIATLPCFHLRRIHYRGRSGDVLRCCAHPELLLKMIGALLHGMDRLGYELEEPFGSSPNCLPTDKLVGATYFDIKLLFWGCDVKLAPLDRDSAQDDVIGVEHQMKRINLIDLIVGLLLGKMEKAFTMGLETIALDFDTNTTPKHSNAEKVPAIAGLHSIVWFLQGVN